MIFSVSRTSVFKLTAWWIRSTTFDAQVNLVRICLPRSSRSSWQSPSRFIKIPHCVVARLGSCPTWLDRTWQDLTGLDRTWEACQVISRHVTSCQVMSEHARWWHVMCRRLPRNTDIIIMMWHESRRSEPPRDHTGSCAYHLNPSQDLDTIRKFASTFVCARS